VQQRHKLVAAISGIALAMVGLVTAGPASASTSVTLTNCQSALNGQTITFPSGSSNVSINFTSCAAVTPAASNTALTTNPNFVLSTSANPPQPGATNNANPTDYMVAGTLNLNVNTTGANASISGNKPGGPGAIPNGAYTVYFGYFTATPSSYFGSFILDIGGSGGGSSSNSSSTGPAPIFQQFGRPSAGTCNDAASPSLNWAGVPSRGWSESWAQWVNNGRGGAVCTRTLVYSNALGSWTTG
jgi:hypothetical protein